MKSEQKITRVKLKTNLNNDVILLGLVSSEPDYKLSLALNKKLAISLKSNSPVKVADNNGHELTFSRFSFASNSSDIYFNLISNRYGKYYLLKKLKNIDYIFQLHDSENEINISQITSEIREIEAITAVFTIDFNTIKDKNLHYLTR